MTILIMTVVAITTSDIQSLNALIRTPSAMLPAAANSNAIATAPFILTPQPHAHRLKSITKINVPTSLIPPVRR